MWDLFSRGAYTVRVLAGIIHNVGVLAPQQTNLAGAALTSYKQASQCDIVDGNHEPGQDGFSRTATLAPCSDAAAGAAAICLALAFERPALSPAA